MFIKTNIDSDMFKFQVMLVAVIKFCVRHCSYCSVSAYKRLFFVVTVNDEHSERRLKRKRGS